MNPRILHIVMLNIILTFTAVCFSAEISPPVPWIADGWQFRQVVVRGVENPIIKSQTGITEIDTQGSILPGGADILVTDMHNSIVPFRVLSVDSQGIVKVEFGLAEKSDNSAFCVYYGNPSAKPLSFNLGTPGGGINLLIKSYESGEVTNAETFTFLFNAAQKVLGQGIRQNINDKNNPFSEGNVNCLAQYNGILRAPSTGSYGLQLKATGPAFLTIDDKVVLSQQKADMLYASADSVHLSRGDHFFMFCVLSRHPSAYIAELYWRLPGERIFKIIPPENFSSSIYYSPVIRQKSGQILNAFFSYNIEKKLRVIGTENLFTRINFKHLSFDCLHAQKENIGESSTSSSVPQILSNPLIKVEWDFGDGDKSSEIQPVHVFRKPGNYLVKLTASNDMGYQDVYTVPISIGDGGAEQIELQWDVQEDNQLVEYHVASIPVSHSFYLTNPSSKDFLLKKTVSSGGKVIESIETSLNIIPREAIFQKYAIPNIEGSFEIKWNLYLYGINILNRGVSVLEDTEKFPAISSKDASLIDNEGNIIIVKVTGEANTTRRFFRNVFNHEKDKSLDIAIIDNSLAPFGRGYDENNYYYGKLKSLLKKQFPDVEVNIHRFASGRDQLGYHAVYRIVSYASGIYKTDPDVLIITPDYDDMRSFPEPDFRHYAIMIHNYIANTKAKIILVTPPPRIESSSKAFAMGISKIALMHEVALADVHQAVSIYEGDWMALFADDSGTKNVYYYDMNPKGQDIIAQILYKAITKD